MARIFIDGHAGTTGLRIHALLRDRLDLELIAPDEERRKDPEARAELLNQADLALLCLPDEAAREAVEWVESSSTRILDASSAHRVADDWVFGLPELRPGQREAIAGAARVSNPGCYSTAVILGLRPLVDAGLVRRDAALTVHGLSGYSGGGRSEIERWEDPASGLLVLPHDVPYALERVHKHVPEMQLYAGLERAPQFMPAKGPFRDGMRLLLPLPAETLAQGATGKLVWEALHARYADEPFVRVLALEEPRASDELDLDPRGCNGTNRLEIVVLSSPTGNVILAVRLDNLGKGAAGAAVQNLNLMLGLPEGTGLEA